MPLTMEGTRVLSPLERDAVQLVFKNAIDPWDISLTVVESFEPRQLWAAAKLPQAGSTYDGDGKIRINRSAFPHTDALHINSTRGNTDEFKPANMHYLSTLIHECTHYWQEVYGRHTFYKNFYDFTQDQLLKRDVPELSANQHASAAQVYFLIDWQLENRPKGSNVNLTSQSPDPAHNVGPVDRFEKIDWVVGIQHRPNRRVFTSKQARRVRDNSFGWLLVELRYGWKTVCQGKERFSKHKRQGLNPLGWVVLNNPL